MFRALAGYLHLKENPNGFEAVRAILGNRDDNVIRNNYAFLAERSLIANAQASIGQTRARLALPAKTQAEGRVMRPQTDPARRCLPVADWPDADRTSLARRAFARAILCHSSAARRPLATGHMSQEPARLRPLADVSEELRRGFDRRPWPIA